MHACDLAVMVPPRLGERGAEPPLPPEPATRLTQARHAEADGDGGRLQCRCGTRGVDAAAVVAAGRGCERAVVVCGACRLPGASEGKEKETVREEETR